MKIPETFMLMGKVWSVKHDPLMLAQHDAYGRCEYSTQSIYIHEADNHDLHTRQGREQTFCHELLHAIASTASVEMEERDIDTMAGLLHQYFQTAKGEVE